MKILSLKGHSTKEKGNDAGHTRKKGPEINPDLPYNSSRIPNTYYDYPFIEIKNSALFLVPFILL